MKEEINYALECCGITEKVPQRNKRDKWPTIHKYNPKGGQTKAEKYNHGTD